MRNSFATAMGLVTAQRPDEPVNCLRLRVIAATAGRILEGQYREPGRGMVAAGGSLIARVELRRDNAIHVNVGVFGELVDLAHDGIVMPMRVIGQISGTAARRQSDFSTRDGGSRHPVSGDGLAHVRNRRESVAGCHRSSRPHVRADRGIPGRTHSLDAMPAVRRSRRND